MTSGHGEGAVIGLLCWAVLAAMFFGGFVLALDISAIVIAAQATNVGGGNTCAVIVSAAVRLDMVKLVLAYGIADLCFHVLRLIVWCNANKENKGSVCCRGWFHYEVINCVARLLVFAFGVALLSLVSADCGLLLYSLRTVTIVIVVVQLPLCCLLFGISWFIFT